MKMLFAICLIGAVIAATLAYLRDPPWLSRIDSGFRDW
jgi:hypothetical protein